MQNKNFRKVLAAASLMAVTGLSSTAMGARYTGTGGAVEIKNGVNTANSDGAAVPWVANDSFSSGTDDNVTFKGADIATYDANGQAPLSIIVENNSTIGSIVNSNGAARSLLTILDNISLTTTQVTGVNAQNQTQVGGNFSGLGPVSLENGSLFLVNTNSNFPDSFDGNNINNGNLTINDGINATFNGHIGNINPLDSINIKDNATANFIDHSVNAKTIILNNPSSNIIFDGSTVTGAIEGQVSGAGIVKFNNTVNISGSIGSITPINTVNVADAEVTFNDTVAAQTILINKGTAKFLEEVTGNIKFTGDGRVDLLDTKDSQFGINGNITTNQNNTGTLNFVSGVTVTSSVGSQNLALKSVIVQGGHIVQFASTVPTNHYAQEYTFNDQNSMLQLAANNSLDGKIVAVNNNNGIIEFFGAGKINGTIGDATNAFGSIISLADLVQIMPGDHYLTALVLGDNANAAFSMANNTNINGGISLQGNNGSITFEGNSTVNGAIGDTQFSLSNLNINGAKNTKVTIDGDLSANIVSINSGGTLDLAQGTNITTLNFASQGGTLNITGDKNHTIGQVDIAEHGNNIAAINIASNVGVGDNRIVNLGTVGDKTNAGLYLDLLKVDGREDYFVRLALDDNSYIKNIELGNNTVVELANGTYKFNNISPQLDGNGVLKIDGNVTLESATNNVEVAFGSSSKKLANIELDSNSSLIIGDNINLYTAAFDPQGNNVINFTGAHKFFAPNNSPLNQLDLDAGGNLTLLSDFNVNTVNLGDNSSLYLTSNITSATGINPVNNNGNVKIYFDNPNDVTIQADIGNNNVVDEIYFTGSNINVASGKSILSQKFIFATNTGLAFNLGDTQTSYNATFTNNSGSEIINTIILNKDVPLTTFNFNSNIATENDGARKLNVQLSDTSNVRILTPNTHGAIFITSVNGSGNITLDADEGSIYAIGAEDMKVGSVNFNEHSTVTAGLFATNASLATNKTFTLGETIEVTNGIALGQDTVLNLADGAVLKSVVNGLGNLNFQASGLIENDIGTNQFLQSINFSDDDQSGLLIYSETIAAADIKFNKGLVVFEDQVEYATLDANVTFDNANVNLILRDVSVNGNLRFIGDNTLSFNVNQSIIGGENHGTIEINNPGSELIIEQGATLKLDIDDTGYPRINEDKLLSVITNNNPPLVQFTDSNVTITNTNPFISYTLADSDGLLLNMTDSVVNVTPILETQGLTTNEADNVNLILASSPGTEAYDFSMVLARLLDGEGGFKPEALEAIRRLEPVNNNRIAMSSMLSINHNILTRLDTQSSSSNRFTSSGDEGYMYGAWVTPFMAGIERKPLSTTTAYYSSYKGNSNGITVGYDAQILEDMVLGVALSHIHNSVTYREYKEGDKSRSNIIGASIYGMKQINDTWYAKAITSIANDKVKNIENRMIVSDLTNEISYDTVTSKYNSMLFSAEALLGYSYQLQQNVTIDPLMGLKYTRIGGAKYNEVGGVDVPNMQVIRKATNKLDVVFGAKITGKEYTLAKSNVTPEAHASVSHALVNKNKGSTFEIQGASPLSSLNGKIDKTQYNLGFSVNANYNMTECGIGYDAYLSKRHTTHRGTLKLRINF
ncbi:MAG: autotransporter domain-containing protein [Rickettsiaceae bacterium]|nr:autotransporter domain-containing protein [Rickettsiaceae bacterium]